MLSIVIIIFIIHVIYDVVKECEIINSSDSSLKIIEYTDVEKILENKFSTNYIIDALKNYTSSHVEHDIYMQNNYNDIIKEFNNIYNLSLDKKYKTLSEIKKNLKIQ